MDIAAVAVLPRLRSAWAALRAATFCSDVDAIKLANWISRYLSCGAWAGKLFCLVMIIDFLLLRLLQLWQPDRNIEVVPDFNLTSLHGGEEKWDLGADEK